MAERILLAARQLAVSAELPGISRITTNQVAKAAGISVGSLYQYFPNIESIFLALYQQMVAPIQHVLVEFDSSQYLTLSREQFFDEFLRAMTSRGPDAEFVFAMQHATKVYPALLEAESVHSRLIATAIKRFMRYYGSTWPDDKLERLALYAFYLDFGTWFYRDRVRPDEQEVFEWELRCLNDLFARPFDE
jgi:AcrR family transcriptional regulator